MAEPRPWTNDEKNFLLAEIIKQHSPPPAVLYNVVANLNPQPRWEDLPLPAGRSLNACRFAFEELKRQPQSYITGPYGPQTPLSAPPPGIKRPFQLEPAFPPQGLQKRVIAPRPSNLAPGGAEPPSASEQPPKRRRGRPPKAETQAREAAAAASRSEAGPAPPPAPPVQVAPQAVVTPVSAAPAPTEEPRPVQQSSTRMPISAVLTPVAPHTASSSSSSSGRRRRGRSMRKDPEGMAESGGVTGQAYESLYGRAAAGGLEDTPARAAVMRHREEQTPSQQAPRSEPAGPGAECGTGPSSV